MDPGWIAAGVALATAVVTLAVWALRRFWKGVRTFWSFMSDWNGEPASPGHPVQPGVMERLMSVETIVSGISHEVHLNSGKSVKDVVTRTESAVAVLQTDVTDLRSQVTELTRKSEL